MEDRNPQSAVVCVRTAPLGDEGNPARHCVRGILWYTLKIALIGLDCLGQRVLWHVALSMGHIV